MIIIYQNKDGSCGALIQCDFSLTPQQLVDKDAPKNPDGSSPVWVSSYETAVPDLNYLSAFSIKDKKVSVDIAKCKEVRLNQFRAIRTEKLNALDVEAIKALESGDSVKLASITSKKQALRDVTKVPLPDTLEEIKATLPAILA